MATGAPAFVNARGTLELETRVFSGYTGWSGHPDLDWTRVGYWNDGGVFDLNPERGHLAAIVVGFRTPAGNMPISGSATYSGRAEGTAFVPVPLGSGAIQSNAEQAALSGTASVVTNFATRDVQGSFTNMTADGIAWNDGAIRATIASNAFSGATSVTNGPPGFASLLPSASGTVEGQFFGPTAQEIGAVWTLHDGAKAAIGTLSGKPP